MNFKFKTGLCLIYITVKWSIIHFIQLIDGFANIFNRL